MKKLEEMLGLVESNIDKMVPIMSARANKEKSFLSCAPITRD